MSVGVQHIQNTSLYLLSMFILLNVIKSCILEHKGEYSSFLVPEPHSLLSLLLSFDGFRFILLDGILFEEFALLLSSLLFSGAESWFGQICSGI